MKLVNCINCINWLQLSELFEYIGLVYKSPEKHELAVTTDNTSAKYLTLLAFRYSGIIGTELNPSCALIGPQHQSKANVPKK